MNERKLVEFKSWPLVVYERAGYDIGWCVWIERRKYSDGTVEQVTCDAKPPSRLDDFQT